MINKTKQWQQREKLRDKGQFWTPEWVAKAMVAYVVENTNLVFDPAAGTGVFLSALRDINSTINYFGIDIDESVLQNAVYQNNSCTTEVRDFIKNPPECRYKSIICNPPYIRHHRIEPETKHFLKKRFQNITGFSIDGRAGYHVYFFVLALHLLDDDGRLAFILPSDICEGVFAPKLWEWITNCYCLDCVVTFEESATPFPKVDTNAMIFFIRKSKSLKTFTWVQVKRPSDDLLTFVQSHFQIIAPTTFEVTERSLEEALTTGLSRPKQTSVTFKYYLKHFATITRGIATGANNFFFLTTQQAKQLNISDDFLIPAIGRTKDITGDKITLDDIKKLQQKHRPTVLLSVSDTIEPAVANYIKRGELLNLPNRPLLKQRQCWYNMEKRKVPPILFAYLGRRHLRFIKNDAGVVPLTCFLCVYPICSDENYVVNLWQALNHPDTIKNLSLVGKSYGAGAIKVEPRSLDKLPIPDHIVKQYFLERKENMLIEQFDFFG